MHWIALQPLPEPARPDDDAELVDALAALGWWALQFTPKVALLQEAGVLVMEVSASERLFGGRKPLLHLIYKKNRPLAPVQYARAATSLVAIARLQLATDAPRQPDALPLATLAAARAHLPTLARIGCTTWGQLRALPRGGVARRFGAELVDALDCAYGHKPELYPWLVLPEVFFSKLELTARIDNAPALMFGARRLLAQLHAWLQARQHGILALELGWELDARRNDAHAGQLVVRTAEPTLDMSHLQRLVAENLARTTLHAPALYLHLRSLETAVLADATASLLPDEVRKGDSLHQLLERLSARLGAERVLRVVPFADHRPERMQQWLRWQEAGAGGSARAPATHARTALHRASVTTQNATNLVANNIYSTGANGQKGIKNNALYPTWLLTQPLKLSVRHNAPHCAEDGGPLTLLAGPQRLEVAWWVEPDARAGSAVVASAPALRDYFVAHSEKMGLLWIYQERLGRPQVGRAGAGWYLHGLFA